MTDDFSILNNLDSIKVLDYNVYTSILNRYGEDFDIGDIDRVLGILRLPRVKDSLPTKIKIRASGIQSGCKVTFISNYNNTVLEDADCYIKISGREIKTTLKVMKILKSILKTGVSKDEELAVACRKMFSDVVKSTGGMLITEEKLVNTLSILKGYYFEEIFAGIKEVL